MEMEIRNLNYYIYKHKKVAYHLRKKIMLSMPAHLILRKASEKNSPLKKVKNLNDQRRSARMMSRLST